MKSAIAAMLNAPPVSPKKLKGEALNKKKREAVGVYTIKLKRAIAIGNIKFVL